MEGFNYNNADFDSIAAHIEKYVYSDDVIDEYKHFLETFSERPNPVKFPKAKKGNIIDMDKSVRWNMEEVDRRIAAYDEEIKRLRSLRNLISNKFVSWLQTIYTHEYPINREEVRLLWEYAWMQSHSDGARSVADTFSELVALYEDLRNARTFTVEQDGNS